MVNPSRGDVRNALANRDAVYTGIARLLPRGRVEAQPEVLLVDSGTPVAEFNIALVGPSPTQPRSVVRRATQFFRGTGRPWLLEFDPILREVFFGPLEESALSEVATVPGMLLHKDEFQPVGLPTGFSVTNVESAADLTRFDRVVVESFNLPPLKELLDFDWLAMRGTRCYLGWASGEPVATALRFDYGEVAGIYCVGTLERARRRGYGRAITERAVIDGFGEHNKQSFLQSSPLGMPVYSAMGYRHVFDHVLWSQPSVTEVYGRTAQASR